MVDYFAMICFSILSIVTFLFNLTFNFSAKYIQCLWLYISHCKKTKSKRNISPALTEHLKHREILLLDIPQDILQFPAANISYGIKCVSSSYSDSS